MSALTSLILSRVSAMSQRQFRAQVNPQVKSESILEFFRVIPSQTCTDLSELCKSMSPINSQDQVKSQDGQKYAIQVVSNQVLEVNSRPGLHCFQIYCKSVEASSISSSSQVSHRASSSLGLNKRQSSSTF